MCCSGLKNVLNNDRAIVTCYYNLEVFSKYNYQTKFRLYSLPHVIILKLTLQIYAYAMDIRTGLKFLRIGTIREFMV
jgi:hypothetical protein